MTTDIEFDSAIIARCTDEERQKIGRIADIHGMDVGAFARFAILEYVSAFTGEEPPVVTGEA